MHLYRYGTYYITCPYKDMLHIRTRNWNPT